MKKEKRSLQNLYYVNPNANPYPNPNGNGKWFANLTYGFNVKLKMTDSENFMKNIKINRTTPVLG